MLRWTRPIVVVTAQCLNNGLVVLSCMYSRLVFERMRSECILASEQPCMLSQLTLSPCANELLGVVRAPPLAMCCMTETLGRLNPSCQSQPFPKALELKPAHREERESSKNSLASKVRGWCNAISLEPDFGIGTTSWNCMQALDREPKGSGPCVRGWLLALAIQRPNTCGVWV